MMDTVNNTNTICQNVKEIGVDNPESLNRNGVENPNKKLQSAAATLDKYHRKKIRTGKEPVRSASTKGKLFLWIAQEDREPYEPGEWEKFLLHQQLQMVCEKNRPRDFRRSVSESGGRGHPTESDGHELKGCDKTEVEYNDSSDDFGGHRCMKCCCKEKTRTVTVQPVSEEKANKTISDFKSMKFGPDAMQMTCPVCMRDITTVTDDASGLLTCISCTLIFLFGGAMGCCMIPFCVHRCSNVEHSCPHCDTYLGLYTRI